MAQHLDGKNPSEAFMTHCQREFLHAQWKELLGDDFLEAYEHGVVIECCDGIKRRFYLRIFAYSADYPEKSVYSYLHINILIANNSMLGFFSALFGIWDIVHAPVV